MTLTNAEFETILNDESKCLDGDIVWQEDEDHSVCVDFRADVRSGVGWPLSVKGSYNREIKALAYVLILKTAWRVYGLDLGKDHHNPQCNQVGEKHKHKWSEQFRDIEAYIPEDITAPAEDPVGVWNQFCVEARLTHNGNMLAPPPMQGDLFT